MPRFATATPTASATPDFGVEGWEPFDDVQLVNGITAAAGWIDMAVDPSLEIAGLSEDGWEEMACFEIVSDATDYVNANGKVSRSTRVVRDRILQAQRQFGMTSAALIAFERDAKRRIYRAAKSTPTPRSDLGAGFDQPGSAMSSLPGPGRRPSALSGTPAPRRPSLLGAASGQRVSGSPLNGAGGGAASKTPRSGGTAAACTTPACPTASPLRGGGTGTDLCSPELGCSPTQKAAAPGQGGTPGCNLADCLEGPHSEAGSAGGAGHGARSSPRHARPAAEGAEAGAAEGAGAGAGPTSTQRAQPEAARSRPRGTQRPRNETAASAAPLGDDGGGGQGGGGQGGGAGRGLGSTPPGSRAKRARGDAAALPGAAGGAAVAEAAGGAGAAAEAGAPGSEVEAFLRAAAQSAAKATAAAEAEAEASAGRWSQPVVRWARRGVLRRLNRGADGGAASHLAPARTKLCEMLSRTARGIENGSCLLVGQRGAG